LSWSTPLGGGGEFEVLRQVFEQARQKGGVPKPGAVLIGPGDDAAVVEGGWVISTDQMVERVHFRTEWLSYVELGGRAVRAALSDLAAMAAEPVGVLTSIAVREEGGAAVIADLMQGAIETAATFGAQVLGGDLSRLPEGAPLVMDVVALGRTAKPLVRSGAEPGDELFLTGPLGGAAAAVATWEQGREPEPSARSAFVTPTPRTREAQWLAERVDLHAGIDISDGLLSDAGHMSAASGVGIVIDVPAVPRHPVLRDMAAVEADRLALSGGEDYEVLVALPPGAAEEIRELYSEAFGTGLVRVGNVRRGAGVAIRTGDGELSVVNSRTGYNHFR